MQEDIGFHNYIGILATWWKWIVIWTAIAAFVAGVISFLLPPTYEAVATIVVTQPRYVAEFDPRFEAVEMEPRYDAFSSLVKTADLEERVIAALEVESDEQLTVGDLQRMATISHGDDPSVIFLRIRHRDPVLAALVANTWAQLYVERVREIYGRTELEETRLQAELRGPEENLRAAEEALVEFEAESQIAMLESELEAKSEALAAYLGLRERLRLLVADAESLRGRLALEGSEAPTLGDNLSILLLEVSSLSYGTPGTTPRSEDEELPAVSAPGAPLSLQLSFDESAFKGMTREEQRQILNNLMSSLTEREEPLNAAIERLSLELPVLQAQLQQQQGERDRLELDRNLAEETYRTLSRKVDEARVAPQLEAGVVSIASAAHEPKQPLATSMVTNVAVAAVLASMVGVAGAFGIENLRGGGNTRETAQ